MPDRIVVAREVALPPPMCLRPRTASLPADAPWATTRCVAASSVAAESVIGDLHPWRPPWRHGWHTAHRPRHEVGGCGLLPWSGGGARKATEQVGERRAVHGRGLAGQRAADAPISTLSTRRRRGRRGRYAAPPSSRRPWRTDRRPPPDRTPERQAAARPPRRSA